MGTVVHNPYPLAESRVGGPAGLLADPQVRADARAALAGGCPASEVAGVLGASVAEGEQLATGTAVTAGAAVDAGGAAGVGGRPARGGGAHPRAGGGVREAG